MLKIRPATIADAQVIADCNLALAKESEHRTLDPPILLEGVRGVFQNAARGVYYLAEDNANVLGQLMLTYEWSDWRNGWFWWIQSVYVLPAHRGQRVFTQLYRYVEQRARDSRGVCGLRLYVDHDNVNAQRIYQDLGMCATRYEVLELDFSAVAR